MRRLFIAAGVTLDAPFVNLRRDIQKFMYADKVTWVKDDVQHLTLRFLGKTPEDKVKPLVGAAGACFENFAPFELELDKIGIFGSRHHPEVIWAGFNDFEKLREIHLALEPELENLGFEKYNGNFVPHVTLARIRQINNLRFFRDNFEKVTTLQFSQTIRIDRFSLIQSHLHSDGPIYKVLKTWELGK